MASDRLVIDSGYVLEAILPTSAAWQGEALTMLDQVAAGDIEGRVPWMFFAEVAAVVTKRVRGRKLDADLAEDFLLQVDGLGLQVDLTLEGSSALHATAQRWQVGVYDSLYLDLAKRLHVPIATRDRGLISGAAAARVPVLRCGDQLKPPRRGRPWRLRQARIVRAPEVPDRQQPGKLGAQALGFAAPAVGFRSASAPGSSPRR